MIRRIASLLALSLVTSFGAATASAGPVGDTRLTNDARGNGGYVSAYTLGTGRAYTDPVLQECSISKGRQNEPAVALDPRNTDVLVGSSNDYCGTYAGTGPENGFGQPGPIWEGYYRSEDGGNSFVSSLVPGYPGDTSPYAADAHVRTASAGDPVVAWDNHGRVFYGAEASDDPAGSLKTFGDQWVGVYQNPDGPNGNTANDGQQFVESNVVAKGTSAPNLLGKFQDKTAIEVDRTGGRCDGNVYFAGSRFSGNGNVTIDFTRSTDHGHTWSTLLNVGAGSHNVQFPEISVTGDGTVYVTYVQYGGSGNRGTGVTLVRSTNCGRSFTKPQLVVPFTAYSFQDVAAPAPVPGGSAVIEERSSEGGKKAHGPSLNRDCGDFFSACQGPYTFFRADSQARATADQYDTQHDWLYVMFDASKPGTEVPTGTTYGTLRPGLGSQIGVYFTRIDGETGNATKPVLVDDRSRGHQIFPDISADGGVLHALWWDSRNDPSYSPKRPIGNDANGVTHPSLDVYAAASQDHGDTWSSSTRLTDVSSNLNYEQYSDRTVPFAGDYLWITSLRSVSYGAWTDSRNVLAGQDPREAQAEDHDAADVPQCRTFDPQAGWSGDSCPHTGELDSNIYGSSTP